MLFFLPHLIFATRKKKNSWLADTSVHKLLSSVAEQENTRMRSKEASQENNFFFYSFTHTDTFIAVAHSWTRIGRVAFRVKVSIVELNCSAIRCIGMDLAHTLQFFVVSTEKIAVSQRITGCRCRIVRQCALRQIQENRIFEFQRWMAFLTRAFRPFLHIQPARKRKCNTLFDV